MPTILFLLPTLVLAAGLIALQIYLSTRAPKWPGVILPGIALISALAYIILVLSLNPSTPALPELFAFFFSVVPTLILTAIYLVCRAILSRKPSAANVWFRNPK